MTPSLPSFHQYRQYRLCVSIVDVPYGAEQPERRRAKGCPGSSVLMYACWPVAMKHPKGGGWQRRGTVVSFEALLRFPDLTIDGVRSTEDGQRGLQTAAKHIKIYECKDIIPP